MQQPYQPRIDYQMGLGNGLPGSLIPGDLLKAADTKPLLEDGRVDEHAIPALNVAKGHAQRSPEPASLVGRFGMATQDPITGCVHASLHNDNTTEPKVTRTCYGTLMQVMESMKENSTPCIMYCITWR